VAKKRKKNGGQTNQSEINSRNEAIATQRRDRVIETAHEDRPVNAKKTYKGAGRIGVLL
jgi:hypothetical protein